MWLGFFVLFGIFIYLLYRWATNGYDFFEKRGIAYDKPTPMLGSVGAMILRQKPVFEVIQDLYNKHNGKFYGIFDQRQPVWLIRDSELLKQITVKDFDHFINHRKTFANDGNIFSNSIFFLQDSKWKDMRSTLTPAFTGSKMRQMFQLINEVGQAAITYLKQSEKNVISESGDIDLKSFCTKFSNDVIASTAFGLSVNSFENANNKFYQMGKKVTNFKVIQSLKFFIFQNWHFLVKLLRLELFDKEASDYFTHLVIDAMKYRQQHKIFRPDMINLLMEARGMINSDQAKSFSREWSDVDIVAQCFLFFFAGFDTTAVLMCTAAHELMENPDIQHQLYEEVQSVLQDLDGKPLTYEALQGMKYMDMVVSEALRKWPPASVVDRHCNADFVYEVDGERLEIKKGDVVWIPIVGFHYDPNNFENPTKFDPERFSDENKDNIKPFTYLPFGMGPRNCIGNRFALLESKAILFHLLSSYRLMPSPKSTIPLRLRPNLFQITPVNGFWMKLVPRESNN